MLGLVFFLFCSFGVLFELVCVGWFGLLFVLWNGCLLYCAVFLVCVWVLSLVFEFGLCLGVLIVCVLIYVLWFVFVGFLWGVLWGV